MDRPLATSNVELRIIRPGGVANKPWGPFDPVRQGIYREVRVVGWESQVFQVRRSQIWGLATPHASFPKRSRPPTLKPLPTPSLVLCWCQNCCHPATFHAGSLVNLGDILKLFNKLFEHLHALVLVDNIAPTELDIGPYLVAVFEEAAGVAGLEVEVVVVGAGAEPNLLQLGMVLLFALLFFLFLLLVPVLPVVHDFANRRIRLWCNFYEVQFLFARHGERFFNRVNTVVSPGVHNAYFVHADFFVNTGTFVCDGDSRFGSDDKKRVW